MFAVDIAHLQVGDGMTPPFWSSEVTVHEAGQWADAIRRRGVHADADLQKERQSEVWGIPLSPGDHGPLRGLAPGRRK